MLRSLYSAISGMNAFQTSLDVTGNNISNVDTTGFKASRVEFSDILSQTLAGASASSGSTAGLGGTNPLQVGLGVNVGSIDTPFTQGADQSTGVATDVSLDGDGFFAVSKNVASNVPTVADTAPSTSTVSTQNASVYYTRAGDFSVDASGDLVLPDGSKLLGYLKGSSPTNPGGLTAVNVDVVPSGGTSASAGDYTIGADGTITVTDPTTNATVETWIVPLTKFTNPGGLQKTGDNLYGQTANSGEYSSTWTGTGVSMETSAGQTGFATFRPGYLEASDVNLTDEFANMIIAQQGFDANSKVINTDNNILSTIQNLEQQA